MSHEIGPLDISDRQMQENSPPKTSEWTEIGEAKITHTIFGKAEVRIVRKHDKIRRILSLIAMLVIGGAVLLGWRLYKQADLGVASSLNAEVAAPVSQAEFNQTLAAPPTVTDKASTPPQQVISQNSKLQESHDVKNAGPATAKPVVQKPFNVIRAQPVIPAANNNLPNSMDKTSLALPAPKASEAPEVVAPINKAESVPPSAASDNLK
jgi:hypothetical protein